MKCFVTLLASLCLGCLLAGAAEGPDDRFVRAYAQIQQGDSLLENSQMADAKERYQAAEGILLDLQKEFPNWNEKVVSFRLNYVRQKMAPLPAATKTKPAAATPAKSSEPMKPVPAVAAPVVTETTARVAELEQIIRQITSEKDLLSAKLREALAAQPAATDPRELAKAEERIQMLEKENSVLRISLTQAKEAAEKTGGSGSESAKKKLSEMEKDLANQKEKAASLARDKERLEKEVATLKTGSASSGNRKSSGPASEVESLRAKLAVLEAQKVPFTAEEQALLKPAAPAKEAVKSGASAAPKNTATAAPANTAKTSRPGRRMAEGVGPLLSEAQAAYAAGKYADAEKKIIEAEKKDAEDPMLLAFHAAVAIELKRLDEAETYLKKALTLDAAHAYSLSTLGYVRLLQNKHQEAFDILSRAAQIVPNDANVQNNLGITLSKLDQRGAAETAFRKALQVLPDFPDAHYNLAVIYANHQPTFPALARFHYNKALEAGHAKDKELEKVLPPAN